MVAGCLEEIRVTRSRVRRVLLFGDTPGIAQLLGAISSGLACGLVGAEIRPQYHAQLGEVANAHDLPLLIHPLPKSSGYSAFVDHVRDLAPDLIMVNSYSMLLREEVLSIPCHGAVNIHGALLPQYRGGNPTQWALINNDTETGVTMHYMTAQFDAGDIIAQKRVPIHFEDTWCDIQRRLSVAIDDLLGEEVPKLLSQTNGRMAQDESRAHYYHRRKPEDGEINWDDSVLAIYNLVRALVKPHPGAFCYRGTEKMVFDDYLSIQQVTSLKLGPIGGHTLLSEAVCLRPRDCDDLAASGGEYEAVGRDFLNVSPTNSQPCPRGGGEERRSNKAVCFSVHPRAHDGAIGFCMFRLLDCVERAAELWLRMVDESGDFCVTETVRLMLKFGFDELELRKVYTHVRGFGHSDMAWLEKIGFWREGGLREASHQGAEGHEIAVMGLLREEYGG